MCEQTPKNWDEQTTLSEVNAGGVQGSPEGKFIDLGVPITPDEMDQWNTGGQLPPQPPEKN